MPVTATATSDRSCILAPDAIAAATSAETAPWRSRSSFGTPRRWCFERIRVVTTEPAKTSLDPGTDVIRSATIPPVHDSAVASVSPRGAAQREDDLLDRPLVLGEEVALRAARAGRLRARRPVRPLPARRRGRRGSRSRVRRSSPPPRRRRRPRRRAPARPPTRSRRRSGAHAGPAASRARAPLAPARTRRAERHRRLSSGRRPGQRDRDPAVRREHDARRRPGEAERLAPSGSDACFRTPAAKSAYGRRRRSAIRRETASISASRPESTTRLRPAAAREQLDRAVVVRRPESARDQQQVGLEPLGERRSAARLGRVADDRDPRRLEAEPDELACQERAVEVSAVAADELAARDEDDRAGTAQAASRTDRKR